MKKLLSLLVLSTLLIQSCSTSTDSTQKEVTEQAETYLDYDGLSSELSGGARMITIDTPKGKFNVWTSGWAIIPL